jgi:IS1 family transposase
VNRKNIAAQAQIVRCLCEGNGIRPTARLCGCAINTVVKIVTELGQLCTDYQDNKVRNLSSRVVQVDEIWAFIGSKENHTKPEKKAEGWGDVWNWTAIDADSKLMITWHVGQRSPQDAQDFMFDLADRLKNRIQLTSDGLGSYRDAVKLAFGKDVDYGMLIKEYGNDPIQEKRYSPAVVLSATPKAIIGDPIESQISTSYVERANLTIRMQNRRFTRLTNGHSKKLENHVAHLGLYFMFYNFCRTNMALTEGPYKIKRTPAMAAGLTDHIWSVEEMIQTVTDSK